MKVPSSVSFGGYEKGAVTARRDHMCAHEDGMFLSNGSSLLGCPFYGPPLFPGRAKLKGTLL